MSIKSGYDIEEAMAWDNFNAEAEDKFGRRLEKKQYLKRRDVYDPRKAIADSKKNAMKEENKEKFKASSLTAAKLEQAQLLKTQGEVKVNGTYEGELEEYEVKENLEENLENDARPKRQYLKRRSKKISPKKLQWKASRRTDCWNSRSKSSQQKAVQARKQSQPKKQSQAPAKKKSVNKSMTGSTTNRSKKQSIEAEGTKLTVNELSAIYLEYHGDSQGKTSHEAIDAGSYLNKQTDSTIPVLVAESAFFRYYDDEAYEVMACCW
eukprot:TRINITY_DN12345_c0_g3_i4.p1 TRINITY_DN12345_c0_g3~~TRINITY_DN12345_c0_g3_i4.p1  ORF type:complete len:310 (+),score=50.22 TRINITY_DN12345_c0_g3_i4:136-930(+)